MKPIIKKKYILAGNHKQANEWVSAQEPVEGVRYYYLSGPEMLKGASFPPEDVIVIGTYWENKNFTAIIAELNHVHLKHKAVNGK